MKTVWEKIFKKEGLIEIKPHLKMGKVAGFFKENDVRRILDLGCGGGRHTVFLASRGFDVYGLDSSPSALAYTAGALSKKKSTAHLALHDMVILPYDDGYFDAVISIQVIHHNRLEDIRKTIREITRVLRDGGLIWITVPVSKNEPSRRQKEIEPGTFMPLDGREKGLPHHYFRQEEIPLLFPEFTILDLHIDNINHYSFLARKSQDAPGR